MSNQFDIGKSIEESMYVSRATGLSQNDLIQADIKRSIMGIEQSSDPIENYGNNVLLSSQTNLSAQDMFKADVARKIMFDK